LSDDQPTVSERWATFDCYGTLIDWETGIHDALARLFPGSDPDALRAAYHRIEPRLQEGSSASYREVMARALGHVVEEFELDLPAEEQWALSESLPSWPVFSEVPDALRELRSRGWRLAILSNTDPELLAASVDVIGVEFDLLITAAEAGSYKPAPGHWERFFELSGAHRDRHVHVAASVFHDIAPATGELGLTAVWINRLGDVTNLPRAAELLDLERLPDTVDALVPAEPDE
jgi:2-haloacid dehalogenase